MRAVELLSLQYFFTSPRLAALSAEAEVLAQVGHPPCFMVQVCHNRLHGHHHSPALDTGAPAIFHFMVQPTAKSLPRHIQSKAACILWSLQTLLLLSKGV